MSAIARPSRPELRWIQLLLSRTFLSDNAALLDNFATFLDRTADSATARFDDHTAAAPAVETSSHATEQAYTTRAVMTAAAGARIIAFARGATMLDNAALLDNDAALLNNTAAGSSAHAATAVAVHVANANASTMAASIAAVATTRDDGTVAAMAADVSATACNNVAAAAINAAARNRFLIAAEQRKTNDRKENRDPTNDNPIHSTPPKFPRLPLRRAFQKSGREWRPLQSQFHCRYTQPSWQIMRVR